MNEKGCPHCPGGFGLKHPLFQDDDFWVVADVHPLVEGHILIIPNEHISCMAELPEKAFARYKELYKNVLEFETKTFGSTAVFEHGITGQTVFHAHVHFLPFIGRVSDILPDNNAIKEIKNLDAVKSEFAKKGKYLFTEIEGRKCLVDTSIGYPRFFRERFAEALNAGKRANWKEARDSPELMKLFERDIKVLESKWSGFKLAHSF
jgi:diadenosine tetraphosphate (Ap4A) HIT family hydrolase